MTVIVASPCCCSSMVRPPPTAASDAYRAEQPLDALAGDILVVNGGDEAAAVGPGLSSHDHGAVDEEVEEVLWGNPE